MKRWSTKPLGDVAQVTAGVPAPQRPEDFAEDGVPFVRMQDVGRLGQSTCLAETKDRLSPSASARLKRFPAGSILVPKSGASIRLNHRAILGIEAHVVSHLAVIVPFPLLNTHFAYYWLCGTDLSGLAHQADLPSMKISDLAKLQLPVPPLVEQERIVKLLDEADELRKLRAEAVCRTADLTPALSYDMFGDTDEDPKGLPVFPFGELLAEPLRNGLSPAKDGRYSAKVFTLSAITGEEFDGSAWKEASFARLPDRNCQATEHLFLICRGNGNRELVGCGKFPSHLNKNTVFPDTMIAAAPKLDRLLPAFLEAAWKQPRTRSQIQSNARTTNGTFKINQTAIEQIRLPVPPLPLQNEFAARVSEIRAVQAEQSASHRRLDDLFQSMLHRAFRGEL